MHKKLTISSRSNLWQNNSGTKGLKSYTSMLLHLVHDEGKTGFVYFIYGHYRSNSLKCAKVLLLRVGEYSENVSLS